MPKPTKESVIASLREIFYRQRYGNMTLTQKEHADYASRPIICTPYGGNYGEVAGWVIAINGSPPKGTLIIDLFQLECVPSKCTYIGTDGCKKIAASGNIATVNNFVSEFLAGKKSVVVLTEKGVIEHEVKIG